LINPSLILRWLSFEKMTHSPLVEVSDYFIITEVMPVAIEI
jgi:hypothetical protein